MEKVGGEVSDMASFGLPIAFSGGGSKKRKRGENVPEEDKYRSNLSYIKEDDKVDIVNQLVLSHGHSHRCASTSIRNDILSIMPEPQMVIHELWPSTRGKVEKHWLTLSEGVTSEENRNYCYYKHLRFHMPFVSEEDLERRKSEGVDFDEDKKGNVWSVTMNNSMPFLSEDFGGRNSEGVGFGGNIMDALKGRFEFGKEYTVKIFTSSFMHIFVIFGIDHRGRYFKEIRILFDFSMSYVLNFNGTNLQRYDMNDTLIFESIHARTYILRLLMLGSDGGARMHNTIFVTSETFPYSNSGAREEICRLLPISLAKLGHRVMVVSPRYQHGGPFDERFSSAFDTGCRLNVNCSGGVQEVSLFCEYREGVDWVFVDHPSNQRPRNPYCDATGDFVDNHFRFTLIFHAACEVPLVLSVRGVTFGDKCLFFAIDCC
ncbi:hypothetical protein POM88_009225 [Heracleum sosnowskyi]|uniref:Starch synthase catalytic domain-containing protein n=1 Tax=Heracleum sosnowskyi TaxID=360622 RepID=A0AAD8N816_9APIA|nr:hypothetical protein POM88_009225 [Heracleum sosnowskyi]